MNLKKLGRMSGVIAAVAMLAMVLQGCGGGDDNNSVEQDLREQLEAATAERDAALTAQMAAEAAQAAAEAAQMTAAEAQMTAAEAQAEAEAAQDAAEAASRTAVAERAAALAAQATAEAAQMMAEGAQATAEMERDAANTAQMMAEDAQATAEAAQMAAAAAQAAAEADTMTAEAARMMAEEAQAAAEAAQMMAETAQAAAEAAAAAETAAAQAAAEAAAEAQAAAEAEKTAAEAARMAAEAETAAAAAAVTEAAASVMAAEAAQAAAEADKMAAEGARMQAEADLATAQAAQAAAGALQAVAEDRAAAAEAAQMAAETAQATAETAQMTAEEAQAAAEAAQAAAEEAQAAAEAALDSGVAEALAAQMMAETERDAANMAKMEAEAAQMMAEADKMAAETAQAAAETAQTAAETAQTDAEAAQEAAEDALSRANTDLANARAAQATAEAALIVANSERNRYKELYEEAKAQGGGVGEPDSEQQMHERATMAAAAIVGIKTRHTMSDDSPVGPRFGSVSLGCRSPSADRESGGDNDNMMCGDADIVGVASVVREGSDLMFQVTEGTAALAVDGDNATNSNAQVATLFDTAKHSPTSVSAPSGWMAVALATEPSAAGVSNHAVVYTNIEDSMRVAFSGPKAQRNANNDTDFTDVGEASWDGEGDYLSVYLGAFGAAQVAEEVNADRKENHNPNVKLDLPSGQAFGSANQVMAASSTSYDGEYDGAAGEYICAPVDQNACGWRRNEINEEEYIVAYGTWEFRPDDGARLTIEDADYLVFGAWLTESSSSNAAREAGVFADGGDSFMADRVHGLEGKATYKGPAAGNYAKRLRRSTMAAAGRFTATAELTANFKGGDAGDDDDVGSIKGSIKDFTILSPVEGIVEAKPAWVLTLGGGNPDHSQTIGLNGLPETATSLDNDGRVAGPAGGNADGVAWKGMWGAEFFGNEKDATGAHPTGVAGVFKVETGRPDIRRVDTDVTQIHPDDLGFVGLVGAFGAELQE